MRSVVLCLVLAGCVAAGGAQPTVQEARLSDSRLTLVLSDGTLCRTAWRAVPVGRMDACGPGFGYEVREIGSPNLLRRIWTELTTALGAEGAVPPLAEVVITDAAGRGRIFASPPPVPEDG